MSFSIRFLVALIACQTSLAFADTPAAKATWDPKTVNRLEAFAASWVEAISGDGTTVVGHANTKPGKDLVEAVRWRAGEAVVLPRPKANVTKAQAVSFDGETIVGHHGNDHGDDLLHDILKPLVWERGKLKALPMPRGVITAEIEAVSGDGKVLVGTGRGRCGKYCGIKWLGNKPAFLMDGKAHVILYGRPSASRDGAIIVGGTESGALRIEGTTVTRNAGAAYAAMSPDGAIVVDNGSMIDGPKILRDGKATTVPALPGGQYCEVTAISADGGRAVGHCSAKTNSSNMPFVWDAKRGVRLFTDALKAASIDTTGWQFKDAAVIDEAGVTIAGTGSKDGANAGFVVVLPR